MYELNLANIPEGYSPVVADSANPYVIDELNVGVNIPYHNTGQYHLQQIKGATDSFVRLVFNRSLQDTQNLISFLPNGNIRINNEYKIILSKSSVLKEIEEIESTVTNTAHGSNGHATKKTPYFVINCQGTTEKFSRCIFKPAENSTTFVNSGSFVLPANLHYVLMKTSVDGIPVISEVDSPVDCKESGLITYIGTGLTTREQTASFSRLIISNQVMPLSENDIHVTEQPNTPVTEDPLFNFALNLGNPAHANNLPAGVPGTGVGDDNNLGQIQLQAEANAHAAFWQPAPPHQQANPKVHPVVQQPAQKPAGLNL